MPRRLRFALGALLLLLPAMLLFIDTVPPQSVAVTRMWVVKRRILSYARQHDALPAQLCELPELPDYDSELTDGWGHPLLYAVGADGIVTLTSLGSDGERGGAGDDADISRRFRSARPDGAWANELIEWLPDSDHLARAPSPPNSP